MATLREGQIICIQEIDNSNDGTQECSKDKIKGAGGLTKVSAFQGNWALANTRERIQFYL